MPHQAALFRQTERFLFYQATGSRSVNNQTVLRLRPSAGIRHVGSQACRRPGGHTTANASRECTLGCGTTPRPTAVLRVKPNLT